MRVVTSMGVGMGGPHNFRITLKTNDPTTPEAFLTVKAVFGP